MAKRRKKKSGKKSGSRRRRSVGIFGRRRSRRRGGKRRIDMPRMCALYMALAMVVGEVIFEDVIVKDGDPVLPDAVDAKAVGTWVYGYWTGRAENPQQFAYAQEVYHVLDEQGVLDDVRTKVSDLLDKVGIGGGGDNTALLSDIPAAGGEDMAGVDETMAGNP